MKPKLIAIFLLIVLSPLGLLAWLGWRATADEQARVQERFASVYADQLSSLSSLIHETISEREREFSGLLELGLVKNTAEIRKLVRSERFVRQAFIIAPDGSFTHPPADEKLRTEQERKFLERTNSIWLSGAKFSSLDESVNPANWVLTQDIPAQTQVDYSQKAQVDLWEKGQGQRGSNEPEQQQKFQYSNQLIDFADDTGWYTWFYGDGVQIIFWKYIPGADFTLGIEVDREALMAEVIAKLPSDIGAGAGRIVLTDASSRPLYQWGEYEPAEGSTPSASIPLFPPLAMWELQHFAPVTAPGKLSTGTVLSLVSGIIAAAIVLLGLAIYFYRENSREMRTAAEKVTFVNQVSHELKTPLTNIRLYAELAEDRLPDAEEDETGARKCLDIVINESQRLSRLIGNVLTFAKPKANQNTNPTRHKVDEIILETLEHFRPALTAQNIEIEFEPGAPDEVKVDADILEQILGNLVSNVEKYAAAGKILKITSSQQGDLTTITVADHGPGIPKSQREKVFRAFKRLSNKLSDGVSGTGIGLTIARDLARHHGGDLTLAAAKPNPGGCKFTLTLKTEST